MAFDIEMIRKVYKKYPKAIEAARKATNKPLTLAEKILYTHLWDGTAKDSYVRGEDYVDFAPDRVAMQDATAQMALLQFMQAGKDRVAVPTTVHADHLIQAKDGAKDEAKDDVVECNDEKKKAVGHLKSIVTKINKLNETKTKNIKYGIQN